MDDGFSSEEENEDCRLFVCVCVFASCCRSGEIEKIGSMMMEGEESDEKPTNCEDAEHDKEDDTTELRVFRVVIHLRSFKASMMLPRRSVNAYVRLLLPSQIVQLAVASSQASSKLTTPLRTHPPVPVDRGTEVNIPNGYSLSLSLSLSVSDSLTLGTFQT